MTDRHELDEAYARLHGSGPEFGGDEHGRHGLTNHGPMAAEVMVRRNLDLDLHHWLDTYMTRLVELPTPTAPVTDDNWRAALGATNRVADWAVYLADQLRHRPWRDVLQVWWPRLLPGIAAGSTHGVIRVGHAVRALRADEQSVPARAELGDALAFWAARSRPIPGAARSAGASDARASLAAVPRLDDQSGPIAHRLAALADLPGWSSSLAAMRPPPTSAHVPAALSDLVEAATLGYLAYGYGSPVLLVHVATAPNAVLHTLPDLPADLWLPSFDAVWPAAAAIVATYQPRVPVPRSDWTPAPRRGDAVPDVLGIAAAHRDEHVIKFTDTAVDVYDRSGDPNALAAALHAARLIDPGPR